MIALELITIVHGEIEVENLRCRDEKDMQIKIKAKQLVYRCKVNAGQITTFSMIGFYQ